MYILCICNNIILNVDSFIISWSSSLCDCSHCACLNWTPSLDHSSTFSPQAGRHERNVWGIFHAGFCPCRLDLYPGPSLSCLVRLFPLYPRPPLLGHPHDDRAGPGHGLPQSDHQDLAGRNCDAAAAAAVEGAVGGSPSQFLEGGHREGTAGEGGHAGDDSEGDEEGIDQPAPCCLGGPPENSAGGVDVGGRMARGEAVEGAAAGPEGTGQNPPSAWDREVGSPGNFEKVGGPACLGGGHADPENSVGHQNAPVPWDCVGGGGLGIGGAHHESVWG